MSAETDLRMAQVKLARERVEVAQKDYDEAITRAFPAGTKVNVRVGMRSGAKMKTYVVRETSGESVILRADLGILRRNYRHVEFTD